MKVSQNLEKHAANLKKSQVAFQTAYKPSGKKLKKKPDDLATKAMVEKRLQRKEETKFKYDILR